MCFYNFKSMVSIMRYAILLMTPIPYMEHSLVMVKGHSVQFSSDTQSCPTLCNPMNCSTPGLLSITNSWSSLKLMSIESVMP